MADADDTRLGPTGAAETRATDDGVAGMSHAEQLAAALDSMIDPHVLLTAVRDDDGHIVDFVFADANQAACAYNGLPHEQLVGARLLELFPGHLSSGLFRQYCRVVETGEPLALDDIVYEQELRGGRPHRYDVRAVRVRDGISYTWRDVTGRHRATQRLATSEELFRGLFETMAQGVVLQDADGSIFAANPAAERILGLTVDQLQGRTSTDPRWRAVREDGSEFPGDEHPAMQALRSGRRVRDVLMGVYHPATGAMRWILVDAVPQFLDGEGQPHRVFTVFTDITERRRLEQRLRDVNQELEEFIYSSAHDLRGPLRAIDGFSELVLQDAVERLEPADRDNLLRVRRAAQRMGRLIDDLAALSATVRREPQLLRIDVSALAAEVAAGLCHGRPPQRLDLVIAPGMETVSDKGLLRTVLADLLDNALKFTSRNRTARIEVGCHDVDGERAYYVRDDGIGFDAANAPHLFGPFQRYHEDEGFPGEGVGLAVVYRLVSRLGGRVWAESEVGRGTTVSFTLGDGIDLV